MEPAPLSLEAKRLLVLKTIIHDPAATDLRLSLFISAAKSFRYDSCLQPFPPDFITNNEKSIDQLVSLDQKKITVGGAQCVAVCVCVFVCVFTTYPQYTTRNPSNVILYQTLSLSPLRKHHVSVGYWRRFHRLPIFRQGLPRSTSRRWDCCTGSSVDRPVRRCEPSRKPSTMRCSPNVRATPNTLNRATSSRWCTVKPTRANGRSRTMRPSSAHDTHFTAVGCLTSTPSCTMGCSST